MEGCSNFCKSIDISNIDQLTNCEDYKNLLSLLVEKVNFKTDITQIDNFDIDKLDDENYFKTGMNLSNSIRNYYKNTNQKDFIDNFVDVFYKFKNLRS
jgi:3-polyprenyl-4-hydroxybenzoate decarboxylase